MHSVFAVARVTFKECLRDPAFPVIIVVFSALIVLGGFLAMFSLGRDAIMAREMALTSLMLGGMVTALLCGTSTVIEERSARTAMSTLAKPVSRNRLVIGKYCGIMITVALALALFAIVVCGMLWAREGGGAVLESGANGGAESPLLLEVAKAAVLSYFEIALIIAVAVALALYLSRLFTVAICLGLFSLGHLTDEIIRQLGLMADGGAVGMLLQALPRLEYFRVAAVVAESEAIVRPAYLGWAAVYTISGVAMTLLISMALFAKREIN